VLTLTKDFCSFPQSLEIIVRVVLSLLSIYAVALPSSVTTYILEASFFVYSLPYNNATVLTSYLDFCVVTELRATD
jgi:hypothetical protein